MTGALAAAHRGSRAVVVEKAATFGGSTARSGGNVWVPGNDALRRAGVQDSLADALTYLTHVAGEGVPEARRRAVIEHGPAMLTFVEAHTPLEFVWVPGYADYYPEAAGGEPRGRTVEPKPLDARVLGAHRRQLAPPYL